MRRDEFPKPRDEYSNPADMRNPKTAPLHRIALSATIASPQSVAQFLVGVNRQCTVAQVDVQCPIELTIEPLHGADTTAGFMAELASRLETEIFPQRTALIFTNTRALAERLAWQLKLRLPQIRAALPFTIRHSRLSAAESSSAA